MNVTQEDTAPELQDLIVNALKNFRSLPPSKFRKNDTLYTLKAYLIYFSFDGEEVDKGNALNLIFDPAFLNIHSNQQNEENTQKPAFF